MRKYICFVFVLCLAACDTNATPAALPVVGRSSLLPVLSSSETALVKKP
jgi:hypothetical protein